MAANSLPTRKGYKNVIKPYGRSGKFYRDITIIPPSPPQAIKNDRYLWFSYRSVLDIDDVQLAGVVMDARIFKDATSAPALSDLSWIERKRTAKVFTFFPS